MSCNCNCNNNLNNIEFIRLEVIKMLNSLELNKMLPIGTVERLKYAERITQYIIKGTIE